MTRVYENLETPGFQWTAVGGGIAGLGSMVSVCSSCAALVPDTDEAREVHRLWHVRMAPAGTPVPP